MFREQPVDIQILRYVQAGMTIMTDDGLSISQWYLLYYIILVHYTCTLYLLMPVLYRIKINIFTKFAYSIFKQNQLHALLRWCQNFFQFDINLKTEKACKILWILYKLRHRLKKEARKVFMKFLTHLSERSNTSVTL